jgi:hypothetical protein
MDNNLFKETPKYNNKPFCLQFHIKGVCQRGNKCNLSHDDPRDVQLDRKFTAFVNRAYQTESNKKQKTQNGKSDDEAN